MRERWPNRPPPNTKCDAYTGTYVDLLGQPKIKKCSRVATETCRQLGAVKHEVWLCQVCAESLAERRVVERNPKKFPPIEEVMGPE